MPEIVTADEAARCVPDGATLAVVPMPSEALYPAFGRAYEQTGSPKDLTVVWTAGIGPFSAEPKGMNHFAHTGMVRRVIAGHFGLNHAMMKLVAEDGVEAYNLPQGVLSQLFREIAAKRPGLITEIGLGTFVDPRVEGGKMNARTRDCEELVACIEVLGAEKLLYKSFPIDAALIRGTTADPKGNISNEDEAIDMECLEAAMAARNSGGIVIAQVERLSETPHRPHDVYVPGNFVDYIVVASSRQEHPHTMFVDHDPSFSGRERADLSGAVTPMPLNTEKIICRRAFLEMAANSVVNLGVGIPMGVAQVAHEEGLLERVTLTTEVGVIGGLPEGGKNFGPAKNPMAFLTQPSMFDFYDGGGIDLACLGMAQTDGEGNVNVSKLGPRLIGCGGFINITQSAKECVFCGEFTAGGFDGGIDNSKLVIQQEGKVAKFVEAVEQITFSGKQARKKGHSVLYVTERCVFQLVPEGLLLKEVAPGVDMQRDILERMRFRPIVPDEVPLMDGAIFREGPMGTA